MEWNGGERADVHLGPVVITLFTRAIYEDAVELPAEGFLHPALFTDDLDAELDGPRGDVGPGGRRGRIRQATDRVRRGARGHPPRVHGAAHHEGHTLPPRVGQQQRHPARRDGRVLPRRARARRRAPARHPRRSRALARRRRPAAPPRRRAAVGPGHRPDGAPLLRRGRRPRRRVPSSTTGASSTCAACRARARCRSGSPTRPATPSSSSRRRRLEDPEDRANCGRAAGVRR